MRGTVLVKYESRWQAETKMTFKKILSSIWGDKICPGLNKAEDVVLGYDIIKIV